MAGTLRATRPGVYFFRKPLASSPNPDITMRGRSSRRFHRSEIGSRGRLRRPAIIDPRVVVFNAKFARPGENLGAAILKRRA
jgi:hypothetical protein